MPFPDTRRVVTLAFQHGGDCDAVGVQNRLVERIDDAVKFSPVIAAMEKCVAARGTNSRGTMCVGKSGAFLCETVEVWRWDFGAGVVGSEVSKAHVIGQ